MIMGNGLVLTKSLILNTTNQIDWYFLVIFTAGHKYENGNAWIVNEFKDFKGPLGGHSKFPSKYSDEELQKAYADCMKNGEERKLLRGF